MPGNFQLSTFNSPFQSYNPDVANAFFRAGMIELWGRGIEHIVNACRAEGASPPEFRFEHGGLWVVFPTRVDTTQKITRNEFGDSSGKSSGKVRGKSYVTFARILASPFSELAEKLGLSTRGVEKQIAKLKSDGVLQRIGPAKGGHWQVKGDDHA